MTSNIENGVRQLIEEGFNKGNMEIVDAVTSPELVEHQNSGPGMLPAPRACEMKRAPRLSPEPCCGRCRRAPRASLQTVGHPPKRKGHWLDRLRDCEITKREHEAS